MKRTGKFMTGGALAAALLILVAGAVNAALEKRGSIDLMTSAARDFLSVLTEEQRAKTVFDFEDEVRMDWHFIPKPTRKGLRLDEMTSEQRHLVHRLVSGGLSRSGYAKATTIMSFEFLVAEADRLAGRATSRIAQLRNPDFYYVCIFGDPTSGGDWGWSIEGHHVSLNYTIVGGKMISSSPAFFGGQPHRIYEGHRKGFSVLGNEEDYARELLTAFTETQRAKAILSEDVPRDIFSSAEREIDFSFLEPEGVARSEMNEEQKAILDNLIMEYVTNAPEDLAPRRVRRVEQSGDEIWFAWMGGLERGLGHPHYYRVHGKSFLIEYDNIQHNANHSHTVWRDYDGDFGRDLLAEHHGSDHQ